MVGLNLGFAPRQCRRLYKVTPSLIGSMQTKNQPWMGDSDTNAFTEWNHGIRSLAMIDLCPLYKYVSSFRWINSLRPRQNGSHFPDDTFKHIFSNENVRISIEISLKFVPKGPINKCPSLVQMMAWRRPGDMPSSEPMMVRLLTHICVTRPQWVN